MLSASKPTWQQMTALVSLSTGGAITGFSLVPGAAAADLTSPAGTQIRLLALHQAARPAAATDAALRSAIVNVANYYLRMAQGKTPAEMEALIWQHDSIDGVDHGASCAAFASLTLELAAQVAGQQSWVTGGTSYPWPLHKWADVRVDPNPASPGITSVLQDAQAHQRWHQLGDGYQPLPGDWVLFDGHVEVVTSYSGGILHTVGGDSLPDFSVNAHQYPDPLSAQGIAGFVNNGQLTAAAPQPQASGAQGPIAQQAAQRHQAPPGQAAIPGTPTAWSASPAPPRPSGAAAVRAAQLPVSSARAHGPASPGQSRPIRPRASAGGQAPAQVHQAGQAVSAGAAVSGTGAAAPAATAREAPRGSAAIPGLPGTAQRAPAGTAAKQAPRYSRHQRIAAAAPLSGSSAEQAFISQVVPGAIAAQSKYGVPASVTIAQAIDESGWGQSYLATADHNLFGIKGSGPAGSDLQPTQEYQNGQMVSQIAPFRVYQNLAQSIDDHGKLLATSSYYTQSMAQRQNPNAFAASLTGVYATDPGYGAKLISLMQQYNLYRYDGPAPAPRPAQPARPKAAAPGGAAIPGSDAAPTPSGSAAPSPAPGGTGSPGPTGTPAPGPTGTPTPAPSGTPSPAPSGTPSPGPTGTPTPAPSGTPSPGPSGTPSPGPSGTPSPGPTGTTTPGPGGTPGQGPSGVPTSGPGGNAASGAGGSGSAGAGGTAGSGPGGAARTGPGVVSIPGLLSPAAAPAAAAFQPAPSAAPSRPARSATASPPAPATAPSQPAPAAGPSRTDSAAGASQGPGSQSDVSAASSQAAPSAQDVSAMRLSTPVSSQARKITTRTTRARTSHYQHQLPPRVKNAFLEVARVPLTRAEPLYRDVASHAGIRWELLAACDWMQCKAKPRYSPVHGEKLGTVNPDGTSYRTKSAALEQCADDLVALAGAVYRIDLTAPGHLSVRDLANAFAAFRWGGLLKLHRTSAMEFPYSVQGLTVQHMHMRWPNIDEPHAPDKPGGRFHMPFGAVPIVLSLDYPAAI